MKRLIKAAGAALMTLALAACVGIPTSGGVHTGIVLNEGVEVDFEFNVTGPSAGADAEQIVAGFLNAMNVPANDYLIAREYLSSGFRSQWRPSAGTTIRTGGVSPQPLSDDVLQYTISSSAAVDSDGRYWETPSATQTVAFRLVTENGELRIAEAPDGTIVSSGNFGTVFAESALYFFDPSYSYLVPDVRWFPDTESLNTRIVRQLLAGPAAWLGDGVLVNEFPAGTTIGDPVRSEPGGLLVDLSPDAASATPVQLDRMRQQLVASLGVADVQMAVGSTALVPLAGAVAVRDPQVDGPPLIRVDDTFGFASPDGVTQIGGISDPVIATDAVAVSFTSKRTEQAAVLGGDGGVYRVASGQATLLDPREGLAPPSLDPFGFIWSAPRAQASAILAFDQDGEQYPVLVDLGDGVRVASMEVSRDGTRLLLYLETAAGPQLGVWGIVRDADNVPVRLGAKFDLLVPAGVPVDATWLGERSIATLTAAGVVTVSAIGGPRASFGVVEDAVALAGGNDGTIGLRVLAGGELYRPQGGGWADTGVGAGLLATKQ